MKMIRNCDIQVGAFVVEKATKTDHQTWLGYAKYSPLFSGSLKKKKPNKTENRKNQNIRYFFFFNTFYTYEAFHQF